jgi:ketol-acid reductoisomerase
MKKTAIQKSELKPLKRINKPYRVASIGFGSMAEAMCRNLRDSEVEIIVGAREAGSHSAKKAAAENFDVRPMADAIKMCDCVLLAIPDLQIRCFFNNIDQKIFLNKCIILCHGLSFFYHPLCFPAGCDIILISPNAIANKLRENYISGAGDYALCSVLRDESKKAAKKLKFICDGLKIDKDKIIQSKLKDEVFSDLFAEQSLLVGGILAIMLSSFETMSEAGISDEASYLSTFHEIKYIVESISELGIREFMNKISEVARVGSVDAFFVSGLKEKMKNEFKKIYGNIETHKFYNKFINPSDFSGNAFERTGRKSKEYQKELDLILNSKLCSIYEKFKRKNAK